MVIAASACGLLLIRPRHFAVFYRPAVWLPLLAGLLLAVAFGIGGGSIEGVVGLVYFAPLLLLGPLLVLLGANERQAVDPAFYATFALLGASGAMVIALYDHFALGMVRAGADTANPIHFADITLAAGFFALIGLFSTGRWRLVFLLGPVFALVTVVLSGSRGPLLGYVALLLLSAASVLVWGGLSRRIGALLAVLAVAAVGAAIVIGINEPTGPLHVFSDLLRMAQTGAASDGSSGERLIMYQSAINAFLASPIFGHGLLNFVQITATYAPAGTVMPTYEHLHSDIADLAVSGGVVGLLALALLLLTPLVEGWTATSPNRRAALFGGMVLTLGYVVMGLTNAMFGIIMLTVFFAFGTAVVSLLARSE